MPNNGYHHVTRDQRSQIYALKSRGFSNRTIANQLGLSHTTVGREIKRNSGERGYRIDQSDRLSKERRQAASSRPKKMTYDVKKEIHEKIQEGWSPEQISGRMKKEKKASVSHETIYRYVRKDTRAGGDLHLSLRHKSKPYNKRKGVTAGRGCIPNRRDIDQRPKIVDKKKRIGDWEGDTIIGAQHQGAIVSYVDRHSKYTLLKKVDNKTAENITAATVEKMKDLPHKVHTITYDNGKEFSNHAVIAEELNADCFFAKPYHSWERGLNEHTNGLVRQYIPKSTNFLTLSDEEVETIENILNHRPRKSLNYKTPYEVFHSVNYQIV